MDHRARLISGGSRSCLVTPARHHRIAQPVLPSVCSSSPPLLHSSPPPPILPWPPCESSRSLGAGPIITPVSFHWWTLFSPPTNLRVADSWKHLWISTAPGSEFPRISTPDFSTLRLPQQWPVLGESGDGTLSFPRVAHPGYPTTDKILETNGRMPCPTHRLILDARTSDSPAHQECLRVSVHTSPGTGVIAPYG